MLLIAEEKKFKFLKGAKSFGRKSWIASGRNAVLCSRRLPSRISIRFVQFLHSGQWAGEFERSEQVRIRGGRYFFTAALQSML